jgi:hypothetical protein
VRREDGNVFDEGGVGVTEIGFEDREVEAALAECVAVLRVLVKNLIEVGNAEIDGGEAVSKITARDA